MSIQKDDDKELVEVAIPPEEASLKEELDKVKQQNEEYLSRLQRLQADFENFKRRTKLNNEELTKYASFDLVKELLTVSDNLQRAAGALEVENAEGTSQGIRLIHKQFCGILNRIGVKKIKSVGEQFDPRVHEAVMSVNDTDTPDDVVVEEIQEGFKLYDKVIRPSKVKVNKREK
ncbi:MAG: nucleotide exchange factor GrpE [Euryarchaeota archaeon]|nr:nucleotide exchange factor GrpE [Euryarchaeota archaeon]